MQKERLLAYTDAVIAIILTIMVLEFKIPHNASRGAILEMKYVFLAYIMSFIFISIYWNNHHHMFQIIEKINGKTLWANSALLFCISLVPFATGWMAENHFASNTVVMYGIILLGCAITYTIISRNLLSIHGTHSLLAKAVANDKKGKISLVLYSIGTIAAYREPIVGLICFGVVSLIWLVPDKRVEKLSF